MISYLFGLLGYLVTLMLQLSVFSQWKILAGNADLLLLFVIAWCLHDRSKYLWLLVLIFAGITNFASALPFYVSLIVYFGVYFLSRQIHARIWQTPLLGMLVLTFAASLGQSALTLGTIFIQRVDIHFVDALNKITLPSLLLNMFLAIPVHALVRELAYYAFPKGVEA